MVENEALVRQGLVRLLELDPEVVVVGEARDGDEALRVIAQHSPDVVLLDVRMPGMGGIDVLTALQQHAPAPACLVLTTFDDPEVLFARSGSELAAICSRTSRSRSCPARSAVSLRGTFVAPAITDQILRGRDGIAAHPDIDDAHERLTGRELEVLRLLAGGYSNAEIAGALWVAERTVKNHVSHLLSKLYVRDRTRAVLKALRLGLL